MITLFDGITTLELPDLYWSDRAWSPVRQSVTPSLTGALLLDVATWQAGRPITLEAGEDDGWLTGAQIAQLETWAANPGLELTLTLESVARPVVFRHHERPLDYDTIIPRLVDPASTDDYRATLRLMEI